MAKRQFFKSSEQTAASRKRAKAKDKIARKARNRKLYAYGVKTGQIVDQVASAKLALSMMTKSTAEKPKLLTEYEKSQQSLSDRLNNITEVARYHKLLEDSKD